MMRHNHFYKIITVLAAFFIFIPSAISASFTLFLQSVEKEALKQGISYKTINQYLKNVKAPVTYSIRHEKAQPQEVLTYEKYLHQFLTPEIINSGKQLYKTHEKLLKKISQQFQVPPQYIIALWGVESHYGKFTGDSNLIQSLATLAYQKHRNGFYRKQLIAALSILDHSPPLPEQLKSSWDGGMGQTQFMPLTYKSYAYDYDKDNFANIWTNLPDVFASIANFLHHLRWKNHEDCMVKVTLPDHFPINQTGIHYKLSIEKWLKLGVKPPAHYSSTQPLSDKAVLILPDNKRSPAYLGFKNFRVLLIWNHTVFEALATCQLANKINE